MITSSKTAIARSARFSLVPILAVVTLAGLCLPPPASSGEQAEHAGHAKQAEQAEQAEQADDYHLFGIARPFIDGRFRFEFGDQEFRDESYSLTWANRVGLETVEWLGLSALAELEHTWSLLDDDKVNRYPGPGRTIIPDPENTELNRLQVNFRNDVLATQITAGRQRIILDDSRFVGNVGWRQNEQTYDGLRLQTTPLADLTLQYAWLMRVNRVFGEQAPSAVLNHFNSDSHLINARYAGLPIGAITGFAYLLDFENAAAFSSQTYGARFDGSTEISSALALTYDVTAAVQLDYANNSNRYTAAYQRSELGVNHDHGWSTGIGYEVLGEDNGNAFQVPLGTNHKFNGYADAFLTTPDSGLRDLYVWIGIPIPGAVKGRLTWHQFQTDTDASSLGNEIDLTLARQITEHIAALGKVAYLDGDNQQADLLRASFEISYSF